MTDLVIMLSARLPFDELLQPLLLNGHVLHEATIPSRAAIAYEAVTVSIAAEQ
jgi:hypothetical protein